MADVDSTIDGIIQNAKDTADRQIDLMNSKVDEAVNFARAIATGTVPSTLSEDRDSTTIEPPTLTLEDLINLEDPKSLKIKEDLDREFRAFLDEYFPDFKDLSGETIQWIRDTIEAGGEALPGAVEGKIWDRARAREDTLNQKSTHEATEAMARRGWNAPPGALTERLRVAQAENITRQASASRDIAIRQAEMAHEMLKFAVQQSVALQSLAVQAAAQFVSEYVRASALGLEFSHNLANAAVNLYQNTVSYYRTFLEQEALKLDYASKSVDIDYRATELRVATLNDRARRSAEAAIEAARALGDSAAAALGAQNTMAATVQEITSED